MLRKHSLLSIILVLIAASASAMAQADRLEGRWEGTVQSFQGQQPAVATFKKSGDSYTGTITGRGTQLIPFKQVTIHGDKVTAEAEVDSPQGTIAIKYEFTLQGDTLKGKGEVDLGGQAFSFTYDLKRAGEQSQAAAPAQQPAGQQAQPERQRGVVPQPTQKQSLDYFAGQWSFKWLGRESAITPGGSVEGTVTFTPAGDGKFLESRTEAKSADGAIRETGLLGFDENRKVLVCLEHRGGVEIVSMGDWSAAISIQFSIAPIKLKGETIRLRRTISVVSAHSFTMTEEIAEGDGPFQRLGNAVFTKVGASGQNR